MYYSVVSVVFGITLRLLVINILSSSPAINTLPLTSFTGDPVDNTWHVAALTANIKAR